MKFDKKYEEILLSEGMKDKLIGMTMKLFTNKKVRGVILKSIEKLLKKYKINIDLNELASLFDHFDEVEVQ